MDKGLTTSTQSSLLENSLRSDAVTSPTSTLQASPTSGEKASVTGRVLNGFTVLFNKPPKWLVVYALLQNQVLFSLMHVLSNRALKFIPPFALASMRVTLAVPFLFFAAHLEGCLHKITRKDYPYMIVLGLVGVATPQTLIFVGNKLCGPEVLSILQPAVPVYVAFFGAAVGLEKLTVVKFIGILFAVAGALVILRPDKMDLADSNAQGVFVIIIQGSSYAIFLILLKLKLNTHPYPFALYAHASAWGVLFIFFSGLVSGLLSFDTKATPLSAWLTLLYSGIIISFFAHGVQTWAVQKSSPSLPAIFGCMSPFIVGILSIMILHTTVDVASNAAGFILNVFGLLLVMYSRLKLEAPPPKPLEVHPEGEGSESPKSSTPKSTDSHPFSPISAAGTFHNGSSSNPSRSDFIASINEYDVRLSISPPPPFPLRVWTYKRRW